MKKDVQLLIVDLDNTLFDWVGMWYCSFSAMLKQLSLDSDISEDILTGEFKAIFQKYDTSEYAFALDEISSLINKHPGERISEIYKKSIHAYNKARKKHLKLYPGVLRSLEMIKQKGTLIIGYTESMEFYTKIRIKKLGLDGILDYVYTRAEHDIPTNISLKQVRYYPNEYYSLRSTIIKHTPKTEKKPNPKILNEIIDEAGVSKENVIYLGDNLVKDVLMAQQALVTDVYAKYGSAHRREEYELLRKVTHWTAEEVEKEKKIDEKVVAPTYTLSKGFKEILSMFEFSRFIRRRSIDDKAEWNDIKACIRAWEKTVDVQQHFNEIELKIRSLATTMLIAVFGAVGFVIKEEYKLVVFGHTTSPAILILVAALLGVFIFFLMDYLWYHKFLYGAVKHGIYIEERLRDIVPEIGLSKEIKKSSPVNILGFKIKSTTKLFLVYIILSLSIFVLGFTIFMNWITF